MWSCMESMTKGQCHSDVLSWVIPSWIDVNMTHYCLVMVVQMNELQSGPLMVKSLTGRRFAVNSKVVPLW